MGNLERGDVVSFRIPDSFKQQHLDYLNKFKGSKSSHFASLCLKGINSDIQNKFYLDFNGLSSDTREWLTNPKNLDVLVAVLKKEQPTLNVTKISEVSTVYEGPEGIKSNETIATLNVSLDNFVMSTFK